MSKHDHAYNHARPVAAEPLLPQREADDNQRERRGGSFTWITALVLVFLTFNSGMAMYRSLGDHGAVAFVAFSYLNVIALFACLKRYETAEPGSKVRDRLKVAVWLLTTALTLSFSYKVAAVMPPVIALVVWLMGFTTVVGGFYAFFCYSDKRNRIV